MDKLTDPSKTGSPQPHAMLRRFLSVLSVDVLLKGSGVLFLPVYLTLMTPAAYASFSYVAAVIGVLSLVCNFGLYVAQSKLLHEFPRRQGDKASPTIHILLLALLSATLLPLYGFSWDLSLVRALFSGTVDYERYRWLIPIGVVLAVYAQMLSNYFLTKQQIGNVQRYNIFRLVLGLSLTIAALCAWHGDDALTRLLAFFVAEFSVLCLFFPRYAREMRSRFSARMAGKALSLGLPIMASAALGVVINFGDKFFIERYCSLADLSVYFLGLTLASAVSLVAMSFQNVWLPMFLKEKDLTLNLNRTRRACGSLLLALSGLSVVIWITAAACLSLNLFEDTYSEVLKILPLLLASSVTSALTGLLSTYTIYWNKTYVTVVTGLSVAVISVPTNYFAVTMYGIYGIAAATFAMNLLFAAVYLGFVLYNSNAQRRQPELV